MNKFKPVIEQQSAIFGPMTPFIFFFFANLAALSISRLFLSLFFLDHIESLNAFALTFIQGIRVDLSILSILASVPCLFYLFSNSILRIDSIWINRFLAIYLALFTAAFIFFELCTPFYMVEYGLRPERKFFEYLTHYQEVSKMLWGMYGFMILPLAAIPLACLHFGTRFFLHLFGSHTNWPLARAALLLPVLMFVFLLTGRSSLDHRPLNPTTVAFSNDVLQNNLPLNSFYTFAYAIYQLKDEDISSQIYGQLPEEDVNLLIHEEKISYQYAREKNASEKQLKNIVIILEESLGARFVSTLGGEKLTPKLDELSNQGLWFSQLYSTGTRSVRGIEAVISGFPPTPARSVVKLNKSQHDFFTLASLLSNMNYRSRFYYGGQAHFDNMKGFFLGNGFHEVIEQQDFEQAHFIGSWGASDEDVFERMHKDLQEQPEQRKFFVTLTTSNHTPFDFPEYPGASPKELEKNRDNAIRYADYALGKFFSKAKKSQYWQDTLFLVVADHDLRGTDFQTGKTKGKYDALNRVFPVDGFHIPGLILGGNVPRKTVHTLSSQIDLPVTLLSLAGLNTVTTPLIGRDLSLAEMETAPGRAIMQYNNMQAFIQDDELVVMHPNSEILTFKLLETKSSPKAFHNKVLENKALAHALWASKSYQKASYQLSPMSY